jgi:hypothetical protein
VKATSPPATRPKSSPTWRWRATIITRAGERFEELAPLDSDATAQQRMAHKLKSQSGRRLYALRKQTVEPVFGIINSVMGFRQFLLRGKDKVSGKWRLVCLAWNLNRMAVLRHKSVPRG